MSASIHVKNIASQTGEQEVRDFFSFCGKISSLDLSNASDGTKAATVTFEKDTAAKTALLLDNTQLGPNQVEVTSSSSGATGTHAAASGQQSDDLTQEDKPRSRILAEYLAHGYVISDKTIEKAIGLDNQHGISSRFTAALQSFDDKYKATEKAQAVDEKYQVTAKGAAAWQGLSSYFEKALETPTGQRLHAFYAEGNKQVMDVHNEARRLADLKAGKATDLHNVGSEGRTACTCHANEGKCACAPGKCACASCGKNPDADTEKSCNCGEALGECKCQPGKCTCAKCPKNSVQKVAGSDKTTCNCGADLGACPCEPGKCGCAKCPKNKI